MAENNKTKRISLTNSILFALEKAIDGYVRFEDFTYHHYRYRWGIPDVKKSELALALKRLRERGLIEEELKNEQDIIIKLTSKGRDKAILLMDDSLDNWDGRWRIVAFDIPEKRRTVRQLLREKLINWGFRRWQKSVWACRKNCTKQLRDFIKQVDIEDWVLVFESDNIGRDTI